MQPNNEHEMMKAPSRTYFFYVETTYLILTKNSAASFNKNSHFLFLKGILFLKIQSAKLHLLISSFRKNDNKKPIARRPEENINDMINDPSFPLKISIIYTKTTEVCPNN